MQVTKEFRYAKYYEDGSVEIFGSKEGYPRIMGVVPAPDINTKSEEEREAVHTEACDNITLEGYLITAKKRIRNQAFDKKDQKTTLQIQYRPAMNEEEVNEIHRRITEIIKKHLEKTGIVKEVVSDGV